MIRKNLIMIIVLCISSMMSLFFFTGSGSETSTGAAKIKRNQSWMSASPALAQGAQGFVVDHHSVAQFEAIPDSAIEAAANLRMFFMDRSVGGNIDRGLTCLDYPSDEAAPNDCKRYQHVAAHPEFSVSPNEVNWSRPGGYSRDNWVYEFFPSNGNCLGEWSQKVECFINRSDQVLNQYDVLSFQFSYLEVLSGSTIADQPGGFFSDDPPVRDVYDLEDYENAHPDKVFIYWTTSLARNVGTLEAQLFNDQMRQYALANDKILFDVADILSHDPSGNPCYDHRDGIFYDGSNGDENFPDDGQNIPAICQHYTSEYDGGHLGSPSAGMIRVAKAFWVLMAQLATDWTPPEAPPPVPMPIKVYLPLILKEAS